MVTLFVGPCPQTNCDAENPQRKERGSRLFPRDAHRFCKKACCGHHTVRASDLREVMLLIHFASLETGTFCSPHGQDMHRAAACRYRKVEPTGTSMSSIFFVMQPQPFVQTRCVIDEVRVGVDTLEVIGAGLRAARRRGSITPFINNQVKLRGRLVRRNDSESRNGGPGQLEPLVRRRLASANATICRTTAAAPKQ
jgi:hypothetical protein